MDKRYRLKYSTSLLSNLEVIKTNGIKAFIRSETEKWRCPKCGGVICIHKPKCLKCN